MPNRTSLLVLPGLLALAACQKAPQDTAPPPEAASAVVAPAASGPAGWTGRWLGPEGTYLDITGGPEAYRITVRNLDGPRDFDATPDAGGLRFTRDGLAETVRPGNGADTGMKWLADKRDCLVVKPGEGYCRG